MKNEKPAVSIAAITLHVYNGSQRMGIFSVPSSISKPGRAALAVAFMITVAGLARSEEAANLKKGVEQFRAGYRKWDLAGLDEAAETLASVCEQRPEGRRVHYWLGVAQFHHVLHRLNSDNPPDDDEFDRITDRAKSAMKAALDRDKRDAEAHAIIAVLIGMEIGRHPTHALWLGPFIQHHKKGALERGEDNPRVQYLLGASHLEGPALLGGPKKALPHLEKAVELFEAEAKSGPSADALSPRWGYDHALVFLGETHLRLESEEKAEARFVKALHVNPDSALAQQKLDKLRDESQDECSEEE